MDEKYPHWYHHEEKMDPCCEDGKELLYEDDVPCKVHVYARETFKDRLLCLLGDEVIFSAGAQIDGRCCSSLCGTLCYVGCDFVIINVCLRRRSASLHIPIRMLHFISPYKSSSRR